MTTADATLEDDVWPTKTQARGMRMRIPTAILTALLIAGVAFWGGAALQKSHGTTGAASSGRGSFPAAFTRTGNSSAARAGGFGVPGVGGAGGGTAGTVTVVQGNTVWVTTSSGSLVKVKLSGATALSRNAKTTATGLKPGDTVVVQGSTKDGTVTATSVSATAKGVTSTGFGGGGFGGLGSSTRSSG